MDQYGPSRSDGLLAAGSARCALLGLAGALGLVGCSPPDRPPALSGPLRTAALEWLHPVSVGRVGLAPGVTYHALRSTGAPWAIHLLQVDLRRCDLAIEVLPAGDPPPATNGRERVSQLAGGAEGVVAAVNGDFFTPEGRPLGWEVVGGRVLSRGRRPAFAWTRHGGPWVGLPTRVGERDRVGPEGAGSEPDASLGAVGGFPVLIRAGAWAEELTGPERSASLEQRDPRTAVGFDAAGQTLWMAVVDGRRDGHSAGMSLLELADLFLALGAEEALNLDGGGSSVMVIGTSLVSRPPAGEGERPVANALAVVRDSGGCGVGP